VLKKNAGEIKNIQVKDIIMVRKIENIQEVIKRDIKKRKKKMSM
jgi:hypothetical protein